jgi:hypothetical protein
LPEQGSQMDKLHQISRRSPVTFLGHQQHQTPASKNKP